MSTQDDNMLILAVDQGCSEMVRHILACGKVDVNAQNSKGETALFVAVRNENHEFLQFVVDLGVYMPVVVMVYFILWPVKSGDRTIPISEILVNAGADVNCGNENGTTPLHLAVMQFRRNNIKLVQFLVDRGANVNAQDKWGLTPLHRALSYYRSKNGIVEILLKAKADVNARDHTGNTPLHILARYIHVTEWVHLDALFGMFVEHGAEFSARNNNGRTALDIALSQIYMHVKFIEGLIEYGQIDVDSVSTPSSREHRHEQSLLHHGCNRHSFALTKYLLHKGAKLNALDRNDATPLMYAVHSVVHPNDIPFIEYLLNKNPDFNSEYCKVMNILTIRHSIPDYLWKILIAYLARRELAGTPLSESIKRTISEDELYRDYFKVCQTELEKARARKFAGSWVSLLNILFDHKSKLVKYVKNKELLKDFESFKIVREFPIYASFARHRMDKAKKNLKIFDKCARVLSSSLQPMSLSDPDHVVIRNILDYCRPKDLREFRTEPIWKNFLNNLSTRFICWFISFVTCGFLWIILKITK